MRTLAVFIFMCGMMSPAFGAETADEILVYRGMSDASAAAAIDKEMFIVADDENNILRIYKTGKGGLPLFSYDMTNFLDIEPEHPEADIEGATIVGQRIYWITSHGRNKDGKMRPNRYRFFATDVKVTNGYVAVNPAGRPYKTLIHNLVRSEDMRHLELDKVTRLYAAELSKKQRKKLAPKENGLNIEGLCASADGETLYIGFRNPRPIDKLSRRPKALVVPLNNPKRVVEEGETPIFGKPILWDLAACGIRSMEYSHFHKAYFIIAGSFDENRKLALYRWAGKKEEEPVFVRRLYLSNFTPEALCVFPSSKKFFVLSDDGTLKIKVSGAWECVEGEYRKDGTCLNKYLVNPAKKTFRAFWLEP